MLSLYSNLNYEIEVKEGVPYLVICLNNQIWILIPFLFVFHNIHWSMRSWQEISSFVSLVGPVANMNPCSYS